MFSAAEFGAGAAAALGAGTIAGYVGLQVGFFLSLCIGPVIGGLIAEATLRATGYKRGPVMYALVAGGIVGGVLIGGLIQYALFAGQYGAGPSGISIFLASATTGGIVYMVAALIGAVARMR
jgi:hypothetical protein